MLISINRGGNSTLHYQCVQAAVGFKVKTQRSKKTCHKIGYSSKEKAREAFNEFGKDIGSKRFYKCPHHDFELWHLTSEAKS
tara:strand:+ start:194 stop:439 length:246 start_codon:yes stop_codon:yes gene_type:complete